MCANPVMSETLWSSAPSSINHLLRLSPAYRSNGAWVHEGQGQGGHRHGVADTAWSQKGRRSWSEHSPLETSESSVCNVYHCILYSVYYGSTSSTHTSLPGREGPDDLLCFSLPCGLIIGVNSRKFCKYPLLQATGSIPNTH